MKVHFIHTHFERQHIYTGNSLSDWNSPQWTGFNHHSQRFRKFSSFYPVEQCANHHHFSSVKNWLIERIAYSTDYFLLPSLYFIYQNDIHLVFQAINQSHHKYKNIIIVIVIIIIIIIFYGLAKSISNVNEKCLCNL